MHNLHLSISDEAFRAAQELAKEQGYSSTEVFLNEYLTNSLIENDNIDHHFTPERLAIIKAASDDVRSGGKVHSVDDVKNMIAERRRAWDEKNPT